MLYMNCRLWRKVLNGKKIVYLCEALRHSRKRSTWPMVQSSLGGRQDGSDMFSRVFSPAERLNLDVSSAPRYF